ncbi:hypothetical protein ACQ4PT_004750 [Festuca glaucescens]
MAAWWRCLLRQISDALAPFRPPSVGLRQRPATWMTSRSVSSNRLGSGADLQPGGAKPNRWCRSAAKPATKGHLYVALEDHEENGFAIHKLGIDDDVHSGSTDEPPPLPPPVVRLPLGTPVGQKPTMFAALGSSIVAMGTRCVENSTSVGGVTVVYDTNTASLTESDLLPADLIYGHDMAMAAGNGLYVLESYTTPFSSNGRCYRDKYYGALHCLKKTTAADRKDESENDKRWRWQPFPEESSRLCWSSNTSHMILRFNPESVTSHAVHPSGRTFLVSACSEWEASRGTFSYSTESGKWRQLDAAVQGARVVQLLYMRKRRVYCLVEYLDNHALRLTMFWLTYDDDGEVIVTAHGSARSYEMPTYYEECFDETNFGSQAFWM